MYFAGPQLQDIVRRHGCDLVLRPYDFQAVAPETGGVPLRTRPEQRRSYHALELSRWSDYLGIPLNLEPAHYKPNTEGKSADPNWNKYAGWMVIASQLRGEDAFPLSHALLRALWAEDRDVTDPVVRQSIADESGYHGAELLAAEQAAETQAQYQANTAAALEKGVFVRAASHQIQPLQQ